MARINTYTTATVSIADDFIPIDGTTAGTKKLSAATPSFLTSVTAPTHTTPAATDLTLLGVAGKNVLLSVGTAASDKVLLNGTLDATAADGLAASIGTLGGLSVKKAAWVGGLANIAGVVTASATGAHTFGTTNTVTMTAGALAATASIACTAATGAITLGTATEVASLAVGAGGAATLTNKSGQTMTFASGTGAYAFTGTGNTTHAGPITESTTTLTGAGAVSIAVTTTKVTTNGVGNALTLADGVNGQIVRIVLDVLGAGGQTAILTPTTKAGYSTITFTAAGQTASLQFVTTRGWVCIGYFLATIV